MNANLSLESVATIKSNVAALDINIFFNLCHLMIDAGKLFRFLEAIYIAHLCLYRLANHRLQKAKPSL